MTDTTRIGDLIKRLRAYRRQMVCGGTGFINPEDMRRAADALEEAERVIAPFAKAADAADTTPSPPAMAVVNQSVGLTYVGQTYDAVIRFDDLRAAGDYLARHATVTRKGGDDVDNL